MSSVVDTNVLIAIIHDDDAHADAAEQALRAAYQRGRVVVPPVVFSELAADGYFQSQEALRTFLEDFSMQLRHPSEAALFLAGERFDEYLQRRPDGLQCPACGAEQSVTCTCGASLAPRQHIAADFLVGAQAADTDAAVVSFDKGFYETYFPGVTVWPD